MRGQVTVLVCIMLIAGAASACDTRQEDQDVNCERFTFAAGGSLAAAGTATCAPSVVYDGRNYQFACVAFRADQLGSPVLTYTAASGQEMRARPIDGVPVEDAVAVSGFGQGYCGHWQLAYGASVTDAEMKQLTRLGTIHGGKA